MRAVTSRDIGRLARLNGSIREFQMREHTAGGILEAYQLGSALNLDAARGQALDQQAFVLVLRKDDRIRERAESLAHIAELDVSFFLTRHPEIRCDGLSSALDDCISEPDLIVQLERARLHGERA